MKKNQSEFILFKTDDEKNSVDFRFEEELDEKSNVQILHIANSDKPIFNLTTKKMSQNFSESQIVYEDNHILVVNKKVGQLVQGDKTGDESLPELIKNFIKIRDKKPGNVFLGLVHRIDRPTSGLVIFAKTSKALSRLTQMVKNREIRKTYWAIVPKEMIPHSQKLVHYLKKNEKNNKAIVFTKATEGAKEAILSYKIIKILDRYQLLEIDLETGRHHQIRAQLSKIGVPIKGDLKYGSPRSNSDGGICLHARKLEFTHPVSQEKIEITAKIPENDAIWSICEGNK